MYQKKMGRDKENARIRDAVDVLTHNQKGKDLTGGTDGYHRD